MRQFINAMKKILGKIVKSMNSIQTSYNIQRRSLRIAYPGHDVSIRIPIVKVTNQ